MNFKKLFIRPERPKQQLESVEIWEVRWTSRHGSFNHETQPEIEVFTSEKDARKFRDALINAFKILRHTSDTAVTITRKG